MSGGRLLSPEELVQHMKTKGITFRIISEENAKLFLTKHTYYTKLAAYRRNYSKHHGGEADGTYQNLDFAYLVELSIIDMLLRYMLVHIALDIEHSMKIALLNDILDNPAEDGYHIVNSFFTALNDPSAKLKLDRKMQQSYCKEFYFHNERNLPVWVLLETLSFGDLIRFYKIYFDIYPKRIEPVDHKILDNVRNIRNACAHNNCLIYDLRRQEMPNSTLANIITKCRSISKTTRHKYLRRRFTQDFTALLVAHKGFIQSEKMHQAVIDSMIKLFSHRFLRHKDYFSDSEVIYGTFSYCIQLINHYYKNRTCVSTKSTLG